RDKTGIPVNARGVLIQFRRIIALAVEQRRAFVMIELKPETEQLVREVIRSGHFSSVDELIVQSVSAWREKHHLEPAATAQARKPRKNLADFLLESPFHGSELQIERQRDYPRELDLS